MSFLTKGNTSKNILGESLKINFNKEEDRESTLSFNAVLEAYELDVEITSQLSESITMLNMNTYSFMKYNNISFINEGVGDFFKAIGNVVKKLKDFIVRMFTKFIRYMHTLYMEDKEFVKKYEKLFNKINADDLDIEMDLYRFTIINNIPLETGILELEESIRKDLYTSEDINFISLKTVLNKQLKNTRYYDKVRQQVIGTNSIITKDDFDKELFKLFRNGDDETSELNIENSIVMNCISSIKEYKDREKKVRKTKDNIVKYYEDLEKFFRGSVSVKFVDKDTSGVSYNNISMNANTLSFEKQYEKVDITLSKKAVGAVNEYFSMRADQLLEVGKIFNLAFSKKLEALKAEKEQSRRILNKVLIVATKKKKDIELEED